MLGKCTCALIRFVLVSQRLSIKTGSTEVCLDADHSPFHGTKHRPLLFLTPFHLGGQYTDARGLSLQGDRLVGLVVKASASRAEGPGFESRLRRDFSGFFGDLKLGTPVVTLPGVWRYRVSAGTGRPSVSILRLGEVESLIYLSVAARKMVRADSSLRYTSMLLGR